MSALEMELLEFCKKIRPAVQAACDETPICGWDWRGILCDMDKLIEKGDEAASQFDNYVSAAADYIGAMPQTAAEARGEPTLSQIEASGEPPY